jgi:conjugal transfer pilus assembly protein TraA
VKRLPKVKLGVGDSYNDSYKGMGILFLVCFLVFVFAITPALASTTSGTEFQSIYDMITGWITGLPGILLAIAIMLVGVYMSFFAGKSPMYFLTCAAGSALVFLIPTLAVSMGGAIF